MPSLDVRKIQILQAIVTDYVNTTRPVGSERLLEISALSCKSATIRNEMAEMSEMGYLSQPHTSAGRIPTDLGYRFYVDELMDRKVSLTLEEVREVERAVSQTRNEIEEILQQTCRLLSSMTSYASLATDPSTGGATIRRIYLTEADPRRVLMIALLSTGHVEHRLLELDPMPPKKTLLHLSNYINSVIMDRGLEDVESALPGLDKPAGLRSYAGVLNRLLSYVAQMAGALSQRRVFLEGTNQLLRQPEFQDVQRLEALLGALEQHTALHQALSRSLRGSETVVVIGAEHGWEPMQECSVIMRSYHIGTRTVGYLGVVGPTRMRYDHAAAAVNLMAQNLSNVLTNLSLA